LYYSKNGAHKIWCPEAHITYIEEMKVGDGTAQRIGAMAINGTDKGPVEFCLGPKCAC
jgi:hypothetical protein